MKRLLILLCLLPGVAHATTSTCITANDGTPCSDACVFGTCVAHVCTGSLRADGTACSTDNLCTSGDQCKSGVCIAGSAVVCPDQSACLIGVCSPRVGCTFKDACPPDLGVADLAASDDLAPPPPDLFGADLCTVPTGSEFFSCDNPPDGFFASDGGDLSIEPFHVRGSRVGDCAMSGTTTTLPAALLFLFLVATSLLRRRG
jgi:hypothetical protein